MVRRDFIQKLTAATGATGLATAAKAAPAASRTVTFQVKGFTCITCAIGLEVVLKGFRGVTQAKAAYPEGKVTVGFDSAVTSEDTIRAFIDKVTGFTVTKQG
jgi:copper chaperone CopZ